MTKFNPENKDALSFGECLHPAMKITDQADADQYLKDYTAFIQKHLDEKPRSDDKTAEEIAKINIGYFAGYFDHETNVRVQRLFQCTHPIYGSSWPTTDEAFAAGMIHAKSRIK